MAKAVKKSANTRKRRVSKNIDKGQVHIQATFNNTIVTITDTQGNAVSWASAGEMGFRGSRIYSVRSQTAAETAAKIAVDQGMKSVDVFVKIGQGRENYQSFTGCRSCCYRYQGRNSYSSQWLPSAWKTRLVGTTFRR